MLSLKITTGFSFEPEIAEQMRGADGALIAVLRKDRTKLEFILAAAHAHVMLKDYFA
jgi:hypothetical protein